MRRCAEICLARTTGEHTGSLRPRSVRMAVALGAGGAWLECGASVDRVVRVEKP